MQHFRTRHMHVAPPTARLGTLQGEDVVERVLHWQEQHGYYAGRAHRIFMDWKRIAGSDVAGISAAQVFRVLDDMLSKTPKGSYIEWYTDLYNLGTDREGGIWRANVMPDVVACGVKARLMRDPSLARLEGRVRRVTNNVIFPPARERFENHIKFSFAKAACRTKVLAWKLFEKSSEARGLPNDVLDRVRALVLQH